MILQLDTLSAFVQTFALATVLLLIWLIHRQRTGKGFVLWMASAVTGIVLGGIGSYSAMSAAGYTFVKADKVAIASSGNTATATSSTASPPASGMSGGMPGSGGGGMGGGRGPNPKRDLTTLVRKLNLLTDDIAITLSTDQSKALIKGLGAVAEAEKFTDNDAKAMHEELLAVLSDEQKAKLEAIGVPGGRGAGGSGGMGGGGTPADPAANPFRQENNLKALKAFRSRFEAAQPAAAE